jgi:hypothetical protein
MNAFRGIGTEYMVSSEEKNLKQGTRLVSDVK